MFPLKKKDNLYGNWHEFRHILVLESFDYSPPARTGKKKKKKKKKA